VSKLVTISKLEALLSRIRTRAAEPRSGRSAVAAGPAPQASTVAVVAPARIAPPTAVVAPPVMVAPSVMVAPPPPAFVAPAAPASRGAREPSPEPPPVIQVDEATLPPPPLTAASGDADFDVEVDHGAGTSEPPAVAPSDVQELTDSRERLSAAPVIPLEPSPAEGADVGPAIEAMDERVELANEVNEGGIAGDEDDVIDETPASSRRPVTAPPEERLAELAFGAEEPQPARHTPPPKSGRLPAPPAVEFDADITGVRPAPAMSASDDAPAPQSQVEPSVLAAQAVRPTFASGTEMRVVDVIGQAQSFAPATFLALLDASLSL
jgi:hypothetical protein